MDLRAQGAWKEAEKEHQMKRIADTTRKAVTIILALAGMILISYGLAQAERADKEQRMDKREVHYDADGDLILMDVQEGLMGVYHACDPLEHIWNDQIRNVEPGLYYLAICEERIELWTKSTEGVQAVCLDPEELKSLAEEIADNTPVLVY